MLTDQMVRYYNEREERRSKRLEKELIAINSSINHLCEEIAAMNALLRQHDEEAETNRNQENDD